MVKLLLVVALLFSSSAFSMSAKGKEPAAKRGEVRQSQRPAIKGYTIKGLEGELEQNVALYLDQLVGEIPSRQLQRYATEQVQQSLHALGYYHARVDLSLDPNNAQTVLAQVDPGKPTLITNVTIEVNGDGQNDAKLQQVVKSMTLAKGQPAHHGQFESAKGALDKELLERGYFDYKWNQHKMAVDTNNYSANVTLIVNTGPRYKFGPLNIASDTPASNYLHELPEFKTGDPYQATLVSEFNLAISQTPYFKSVRVYANIAKRKNQEVPIRVEVLHKPTDSFEVGGGYSTDLGAKVRFKWSRPWITDDGHYLESNLNVSQRQQDITFAYTVPVDDPIDDIWRFSAGYKLEDQINDEIYSETLTALVQRQWKIEKDWVRTAFIRREYETFRIGDEETSTKMLLPGISFARKRSEGGTTPYWGEQWLISTEVGSESLASSTDIVRVQMAYAWLNTYAKRHLIFTRMNLGAIYADDIHDVPLSLRFYAGGDQSVRGYKYEGISPEENGFKIGGKYLVTGTLEYNYQFLPKWRAALFVDAGTATNDFSEDVSVGAGLGIRYITPVGPIRLDYAWALSTPNYTTRISFTVGPEI